MAKSAGVAHEVMGGSDSITNSGRWTTHIGFCLMLSWHYLLLFSPAFGDIERSNEFDYLFLRQLALYIALAVTFYVIWAFGKWRMRKGTMRKTFTAPTLLIGIAASALSLLYVSAPYLGMPIPVRIVLIAAVGVFQGYCMVLWVRCLMNKGSGHVLPSFGKYMIAGGAIALLVCFFQWPIQGVVTSVIPFATSLLLTYERNQDKNDPTVSEESENDQVGAAGEALDTTEAPEKDQHEKILSARNRRTILFATLFAFTFGLLQGSFIVTHIPVLIVNDAVVLVGIIFAGLLIHIIPKNLGVPLSVDMMHRFSLILFVVGSIVITWYTLGSLPLFLSQIALLAGFNLFDFGVFVYGIEGHWGKDRAPNGADFARPIVYLGMTSGLLLGRFILGATPSANITMTLLIVCGISVIAMVVTTLVPLYHLEAEDEDAENSASASPAGKEKQPAVVVSLSSFPTETFDASLQRQGENGKRLESPWRNACHAIAKWYQLSPRETEIFMLVAKGRNADYIQQALTISTHTAKTHIANIYHKLDVHSMQEVLDLVEKYRDDNEPGRAKQAR